MLSVCGSMCGTYSLLQSWGAYGEVLLSLLRLNDCVERGDVTRLLDTGKRLR